tara:strand:- start:1995 stop:2321 length:327 start_codon:yes stop_codon:yes gene_type:complete
MKKTCFECGSTENIEKHHVVPRSKGGKKTIPLCARCHDKVHEFELQDEFLPLSKELKPTLVKLLKSDTKKSYGAFAKALNRRGIKTARGRSFVPTTVRRVFLRLGLSF